MPLLLTCTSAAAFGEVSTTFAIAMPNVKDVDTKEDIVEAYLMSIVVLLLITLTALWIPPNQEDRMHMCLLNLILHFMHLEYVSDMVPTHGPNTPYLVCYSRDSMLLASFSILFSIMLKNFIEGSVHAPAWVSNSITFLADYKILELVLLNDHTIKGEETLKVDDELATIIDNTNNNPTENQDWLVFGKVLDRILFIIYCIVYIIMFVSFLP
ncbi:hypothetical protein WA026_007650 [Henosepilachna vigintioctopunctata]|uniref:Uncharacterized protein n=1 Tax=Henosepilachna vigintioctopunctata TaxID=420089 RepID=A0AAW1TYC2_9CUCU